MNGSENSPKNLPRHIAIIMDGNGRWALSRGLKRSEGHRAGAKALKQVISNVFSMGIPYLSVYAFSVDNWKREKSEVRFLIALMKKFYKDEFPEIHANGIRVVHSGVHAPLPDSILKILAIIQEKSKNNTKGTLNLCLNYGGRSEIIEATKKIAQDLVAGKLKINELDYKSYANYLFQPSVPDVDLLIRTSSEYRISDFLLWQCAYAEFYFTATLWPDFDKNALREALEEYQKRDRRFGGLKQ
jgi:undecaprenyl diphosphate synthase